MWFDLYVCLIAKIIYHLKENLMSISIYQAATIYDKGKQSYGWFSKNM